MFSIIQPGARFDFMSKAGLMSKISLGLFLAALVVVLGVGLKFGLDFSGGHEVLLEFSKPVEIGAVRSEIDKLGLGDSAVQSFEIPGSDKTHYLVRVQRAETLSEAQVKAIEAALVGKYGDKFQAPVGYNKEIGNVVEVDFTVSSTSTEVDTSSIAVAAVVNGTGQKVRQVREIGAGDKARYSVTLSGVDKTIVDAMKGLDPTAAAPKVGFVGPTVGEQLRNDGILACLYALLCILIYIALRFDFFYGPGAVLCLFHDAVITVAILGLIGHEFSLATVAGILTLIGYSINDTIVVFDRIRETVGKVTGHALKDVINRAISETLGRTLMTSFTTFGACMCLMSFGKSTVLFDFGLIMAIGVIIGTYSSIYVASPAFMFLRLRFGPKQVYGRGGEGSKTSSAKPHTAST